MSRSNGAAPISAAPPTCAILSPASRRLQPSSAARCSIRPSAIWTSCRAASTKAARSRHWSSIWESTLTRWWSPATRSTIWRCTSMASSVCVSANPNPPCSRPPPSAPAPSVPACCIRPTPAAAASSMRSSISTSSTSRASTPGRARRKPRASPIWSWSIIACPTRRVSRTAASCAAAPPRPTASSRPCSASSATARRAPGSHGRSRTRKRL